jgi:hypothetical protein
LTIKNLLGLALRQATGVAQSLPSLPAQHWLVPNFSTLHRQVGHDLLQS